MSLRPGLTATLTLSVSILLAIASGTAGAVFLRQKQVELTAQAMVGAVRGAVLTTRPLGLAYETYYQSGFATFGSEVSRLRALLPDIAQIRIVAYKGGILYDANAERDAPTAEHEAISDESMLLRVQRVEPTVAGEDGIPSADLTAVARVDSLDVPARVTTVVVPYLDELGQHPFSILYDIDYSTLDAILARTRTTVLGGTLAGVLLALLTGFVLARWIVRPVRQLTKGARIFAGGALAHRIPAKRTDELGELARTFNRMAEELEQNVAKLVTSEKLAREVELAATIQRDLLPKSIPDLPGLQVVAQTFPADQVGGDSFDLVRTPDERTVLYVGDVTGHGLPAALVMAVANAVVYAEALEAPSTKELVAHANRILQAKTPANIFMTMTVLQWDELTQELTYTGAGHDDFLVYRAASRSIESVRPGGMILGALPDVSAIAQVQRLPLDPGDTVILTTDGIPEARNPAGELYGAARLRTLVQAHAALALPDLFTTILNDVMAFMGGVPQSDDITLILLRRVPGPAPRARASIAAPIGHDSVPPVPRPPSPLSSPLPSSLVPPKRVYRVRAKLRKKDPLAPPRSHPRH